MNPKKFAYSVEKKGLHTRNYVGVQIANFISIRQSNCRRGLLEVFLVS
jgi:hypothetical protein